MLAGIAVPVVSKSIQRGKESTLKEDLFVLRKTINDYYADHGHYPDTLDDLVTKGYIRSIPIDPMTERSDTWLTEQATTGEDNVGIWDVRSGSSDEARDGKSYDSW